MKHTTVTLVDYNPNWLKKFEYEKTSIINAIGDQILHIEHIGSTAIIGLKAKPIIDIMVGIHHLEQVSPLVQPLQDIGYEYVPKIEFKDRKFFRKGQWGQGTCHLHICEYDSSEWREKILFRNYLRNHPEFAEEYALLKTNLASEYAFDRHTYTKNKEPFIRTVLQKAKLEKDI